MKTIQKSWEGKTDHVKQFLGVDPDLRIISLRRVVKLLRTTEQRIKHLLQTEHDLKAHQRLQNKVKILKQVRKAKEAC